MDRIRPLIILLFTIFSNISATNYYSFQQLDPAAEDVTDVNNWSDVYGDMSVAYGGAGSSPTDFSDPSDVFHIVDGDVMLALSAWTVAGTVEITSNCTFDASGYNHAIKLDIQSAGIYKVFSSYNSLTFGTVATDAEFHIYTSSNPTFFRTDLTYPNLYFDDGGTLASFSNTLNVAGSLFINGKTISVSTTQARTLNITGNLEVQAGTFRFANGTASSTINIGGDLVVSGGTLVGSASSGSTTINVTGSFSQSGGTFQGATAAATGNPTFVIGGDFAFNSGTYRAKVTPVSGVGRVQFNMNGTSKTITSASMTDSDHKFVINGSVSLMSNFTISNTLTLNGSLAINSNTLTVGNSLTGAGSLVGGSTSSITFNPASVGATLPAVSLNNLILNRSGQTITMAGNVDAASVQLSAGTLSIGANTLTLSGSISGVGTLTGGATSNLTVSTVGAASTNIPSVFLNNFTVNRTSGVSLSGNVTVNGTLTLTAGAVDNATVSNSLILGSSANIVRNSGSLQAAPVFGSSVNVTYTGNGSISVDYEMPTSSTVLNNVTFSKTGTVTLINPITVNGILTISSGTLNTDNSNNYAIDIKGNWVNNSTFTANNNIVTFSGTTTISGSGTHNFSSILLSGTLTAPTTLNISGNFTNNGTFNQGTSTVSFNGSGSVNIAGTQKTTFYTINLSKLSGGVIITGDTVKVINLANITSGTLTTNNKFVLTATADDAYASLLDANSSAPNGSVIGDIVFHRILDPRGGTTTNGNAAMYSSPFSDGTVSDFQSDTKNFFFLDASSATFTKATSTGQSLPQAIGFSRRGAKFGESTYLVGAPGNGTITPSLVTSASGTFNLVGNPYPSTINWSSVTKSNLGGSNAIYLFNGTSWNTVTSGNVSVAQGFQVLALTGANLQFTNSCRISTPTSFLRVGFEEEPKIALHLKGLTGLTDESFIVLNDSAKSEFDIRIDAPKLFPSVSDCPGLSLVKSGKNTVMYHTNKMQSESIIPLYTNVNKSGIYTLNIEGLDHFDSVYKLYLRDNQLNTLQQIQGNSVEMALEISPLQPLRYELLLSNVNNLVTSFENNDKSFENNIWVYSEKSDLFVKNNSDEEIESLSIFDLNGNKVSQFYKVSGVNSELN